MFGTILAIDAASDLLRAMLLSTVRLAGALIIAPFIPHNILTGILRSAFLFSLGLIICPVILPTVSVKNIDYLTLVAILAKESLIGFCIGFLCSMIFWVAEVIGNLIDNQRGANMAEVYAPLTGSQTSTIGLLISQAVLLVFYHVGGFLMFLSVMFKSYQLWPVSSFFPQFTSEFPLVFLNAIDNMMTLAFIFASPVAMILFLSTFGLGLINRFAPQLNVFFLSMPINSAIAVFILILYFPYMMQLFGEQFASINVVLSLLNRGIQ